MPDGRLFDADGPTTLAKIKKRYGFETSVRPIRIPSDECNDDDWDDGDGSQLAAFVVEYLNY
jgi:hypothetical protein